jgi:catechol 2,3-dioxygenase-like lactoylglutathione lyase family enzyme
MMIPRRYGLVFSLLIIVWAAGCGQEPATQPEQDKPEEQTVETSGPPNIIANNAFFYYKDLDAAWSFYSETLGLETVADYEFAKIMRVAGTSYLTLVDAESGMHTADEPKTVAIALITDQLDEWYEYLSGENVPMRHEYDPVEGRPHHGFVLDDPEGYYLEFERFNPHPENEQLMPLLDQMETIYPETDSSAKTPKELGFKATVIWMYYNDLEGIQRFYEDVMGFDLVVDQGWAKIYPTSPTGFIGPVDGAKGMHSWTEKKGVTVSFFTDDVDGWFAHLQGHESFEFRNPEVLEEDRAGVRVFVGYDPEGYFLEFDTFLETEANQELVELLRANK